MVSERCHINHHVSGEDLDRARQHLIKTAGLVQAQLGQSSLQQCKLKHHCAVLTVSTQMSIPLEKLEQRYASEVMKVDADEDLLKRLERGIRGLKGVTEWTGEGQQPFTKVIQALRDEMQLLRSELAARNTEAKSIAFSSVSGAAANQLLEDLHLTEADGFEEAPFETPAGVSDIDTFDFSQFVDEDAGTPSFVEYHHQQLQACGCTPTQAYHEMADFLLKQGTMLTSKQTIPEPPAELEEKLCRPIKKLKGLVQGYSAM
ncbi:hypothetical protein WJX79_007199 [Trebouxia sp. C0005]